MNQNSNCVLHAFDSLRCMMDGLSPATGRSSSGESNQNFRFATTLEASSPWHSGPSVGYGNYFNGTNPTVPSRSSHQDQLLFGRSTTYDESGLFLRPNSVSEPVSSAPQSKTGGDSMYVSTALIDALHTFQPNKITFTENNFADDPDVSGILNSRNSAYDPITLYGSRSDPIEDNPDILSILSSRNSAYDPITLYGSRSDPIEDNNQDDVVQGYAKRRRVDDVLTASSFDTPHSKQVSIGSNNLPEQFGSNRYQNHSLYEQAEVANNGSNENKPFLTDDQWKQEAETNMPLLARFVFNHEIKSVPQQQVITYEGDEVKLFQIQIPPRTAPPSSASSSSLKKKNTGTKAKKERDPDEPKRPLTAYNFFFKHVRATIVGENPDCEHDETVATAELAVCKRIGAVDLQQDSTRENRRRSSKRRPHRRVTFRELAGEVSTKWKEAEPEIKQLYNELAALEKIRYAREKAAYQSTLR